MPQNHYISVYLLTLDVFTFLCLTVWQVELDDGSFNRTLHVEQRPCCLLASWLEEALPPRDRPVQKLRLLSHDEHQASRSTLEPTCTRTPEPEPVDTQGTSYYNKPSLACVLTDRCSSSWSLTWRRVCWKIWNTWRLQEHHWRCVHMHQNVCVPTLSLN